MFADSFCDSGWANRPHRGWTTLASFGVQALAVGGLLVLPLLYTQGLPQLKFLEHGLAAPAPPPGLPAPAEHVRHQASAASNLSSEGRMITPPSVPREIAQLTETTAPAPVDASSLSVWGGTGDSRARNSAFGSIGTGLFSMVSPPPPVAHQPPISRMMEGNLIHRVQPVYPHLAIQARIQGEVVLRAIISRDGRIDGLQVVSGHPMLAPAAVDAVRQWRYRPYVLNGEPVEVETQVTVRFVLSGG
jgi:protein TonB